MTGNPQAPLRVDLARELFFSQGCDPGNHVAPLINRSWQRCRAVAEDPREPEPIDRTALRERREQSATLLECARAELDVLFEHVVGNGCVVILSDYSGLILDEIGSPEFLPKARRVALKPGVEWSERQRGTNAIGTALMERAAVMVLGREHYLPRNDALGCAAAPIFTGRGDLAGVLDISGEVSQINHHALGLVRMAAQHVEHRMIACGARGELFRFHSKPDLVGTEREALLVIDDGCVTAANQVALSILRRQWHDVIDQPVEALLGRNWPMLGSETSLFRLPSGEGITAAVAPAHRPAPRRQDPARSEPHAESAAPAPDPIEPLLRRAVRVINEGVAILVTGETGTGKEVFARKLHRESRRCKGPFVAVNCAALPETLIEAELFGYVEGAFSGARRQGRPGRIREADGGILFLDEIGDMPVALQTRLLRVLEDRLVAPLGGGRETLVDFDLICATHRDIPALLQAGDFRSDLLYRLNGFSVALPPLRRREDRCDLIRSLFDTIASPSKRLTLSEAALAQMCAYPWPGNIRELIGTLRSLVALSDTGDIVTPLYLPDHIQIPKSNQEASQTGQQVPPAIALSEQLQRLSSITRGAIDEALVESSGRVGEAAERLGIHRSTLYRHLARRKSSQP